MKAKSNDISVRELFRRKLENATVIPDVSVSSKLMRKLAIREFVRFNPGRFNIYYLGGILLAGITAGILIFSQPGKSEKSDDLDFLGIKADSGKKAVSTYINIPAGNIISKKVDKSESKKSEIRKNNLKQKLEPAPEIDLSKNSKTWEKGENVSHVENSSFSKKSLFTGSSAETSKLKGGYRKNEVLFEPSASSGCTPLKIHFSNKVSSSDSCSWVFGDGGYSNQKNPDWIFDVAGEYKVNLNVFGKDGSKSTYSSVIKVYPRPHARFEISPDKAVIPDDEIRFINFSSDGISYKWNFGDGSNSDLYEPKHSYTKYSNYNVSLIVTSELGCTDSLMVLNAFSGSHYYIDFPNAFIPNPEGSSGGFYSSKSDETTQVFHPGFSGVSDYQLKIFSKLGILLFESNDVNIGWDGYFKGQLSNPGVYIWKVRGNFRNGESFIKMGDVTLLGH